MSAFEAIKIVLYAVILIGIVMGALWFALIYTPDDKPGGWASVECSEEDFNGLCGVRKFFEGDISATTSIDL